MAGQLDFKALFRSSPYPYIVVDTQLTIVEANDAYLRATGAHAGEIVGRHLLDAFPTDDAERLLEVLEGANAQGVWV